MNHKTFGRFFVLAFLLLASISLWAQSNTNSAKALFKSRCALCHGEDGRGKTNLGQQMKAFDLNSAKVQRQKNSVLKQVIVNGKGNMPPFQATLSDDQINQLLKYVRTFGKKH
jgi:mono/diheme cytochrome c family protein